MNTQPLSWLKKLEGELNLAKQVPLLGSPPPFPWEELSTSLAKHLEMTDLSLTSGRQDLYLPSEFLSSFGKNPIIRSFELSPLNGPVFLVVSAESVKKIVHLFLLESTNETKLSDPSLEEGFFEYLLLNASESFTRLSLYPDLQLQWIEAQPLPSTLCFCKDFTLTLRGESFTFRLITTRSFHRAFADHFSQANLFELLTCSIAESIEVCLSVQTGFCSLPKKQWDEIHVGDFLILDHCSYDPLVRKGIANLSLAETPFFKIKIKKDKLKVLEYSTERGYKMDGDDLESVFPEDEPSFDALEEGVDQGTLEFEEKLVSSLEIPFPIVVEIDRISMPLKKLLSLQPGNILELPMDPHQGVYLTVHGKKIAKGELLKLGDAIGVKIVELGEPSSV